MEPLLRAPLASAAMQPREQSVGRAVLQFALPGLAAVLLLGLVAVQLLRSTGTSEAIADAKRLSRLAGDAVVAPRITPAVLRGDPRAIAALERVVRHNVLGRPFVRVKVWDATGRIVFSDERRLIGSRYPLGAEETTVLRGRDPDAEVSDLSRPENRYERRYHKLLEVYGPIRTPGGRRLLFESYLRFSSVAASARRTWLRFLPALAGTLVLLELVQIPLAYLLARRLRERQRERNALLERALDASQSERRRIAGELHDGPVQDLAGVAFGLSAAAGRMNGSDAASRTAIEQAACQAREVMRDLRGTLVDLYPPSLHRSGLRAPLTDLLARLSSDGVETGCDVAADLELSSRAEAVLYRVARETLQNVRKHAGARRVDVTVSVAGGTAVLTVSDDGRGFEMPALRDEPEDAHLGLRLITDLVAEAGGRMTIESEPGRGTRVRAEVPK